MTKGKPTQKDWEAFDNLIQSILDEYAWLFNHPDMDDNEYWLRDDNWLDDLRAEWDNRLDDIYDDE